jgi:hypothetical protein
MKISAISKSNKSPELAGLIFEDCPQGEHKIYCGPARLSDFLADDHKLKRFILCPGKD